MVEIRADVKSDSREVVIATKRIEKLGNTTKKTSRIIDTTAKTVDNLSKGFDNIKETLKGLTGAFLSMLFFGMMIQQIFTSALKSIFEGFAKATGEGGMFNQLTQRLSANWEFFKFQLASALADSTLFQGFINFLIKIIQIFQSLPKPVKLFITLLLVVGAIFGFILFMVGQLGLGLFGIVTAMELIGISSAAALGGILLTIGAILLMIALLTTAFSINSDHINDLGLEIDGFWNNVASIVVTTLAGIANLVVFIISGLIQVFLNFGNIILGIFDFIWGAIKAIFTSDTIEDALDNALDNVQKRASNISSAFGALTQDVTAGINELEFEAQQSLSTTPNDRNGNVIQTTNNFYTLDEALAQGIISPEEALNARNNGFLG